MTNKAGWTPTLQAQLRDFRPAPARFSGLFQPETLKTPPPSLQPRPVAPSDRGPVAPGAEARVSDARRSQSDVQVPPRPQAPPRLWPFPASRVLNRFSLS